MRGTGKINRDGHPTALLLHQGRNDKCIYNLLVHSSRRKF